MNVLMTVAILGALLLGDWAEAAAAAALFAIGNLAQSLTFDRTRNALSSLSTFGTVRGDSADRRARRRWCRSIASLRAMSIRVKPGERFPIDGIISEGATTVDESLITGESLPADKRSGSQVFAGSLNGSGSVVVEVTRTAAESTLANIVDLVEEARGGRGHAEQTIDRFAAIYTPVVVGLAALLAMAGGRDHGRLARLGDARTRAAGDRLSVRAHHLYPGCNRLCGRCGRQARISGKGGAALEAIASIRTVVFDKTGTLTRGRPIVTEVRALDFRERELLRLAAAVEALSEHPLGLAVIDHAAREGIEVAPATDFAFTAAVGLRRWSTGAASGSDRRPGSMSWAYGLSLVSMLDRTSQGQTVLLVADEIDGTPSYLGSISRCRSLRQESHAVVELLRPQGIAPVAMMTGDNRATANTIAAQCGIELVYAELLPGEKASRVGDLREQSGAGCDGRRWRQRRPGLGAANIGFAMGLTGSDLAVETADVAILRNDLFAVPGAIDLSRRTVAIIRQNIGISLAVKVVALVLTLFGITTLWMAVAVDLGTSLLVTANALRLTRWQLPGLGPSARRNSVCRRAGTGEASGLATGDA